MYSISNQIKFTTLRANLCDYSDAYREVKITITVPNMWTQEATWNHRNKNVIFRNCTPFTNCTGEINNTKVDEAHDIDLVIPMYILIWWYVFENIKKFMVIL